MKLLALLLTLAVVVFAALTTTTFVEDDWRQSVDSAIYLITAQNMGAGEGYSYLGQPFFSRPPGLSAVLAPFVTEGLDHARLNLFIQASAAAAMLLLLLVMRRWHGALLGAAVTLVAVLNPEHVLAYNAVLSEFPHLAVLFAALLLLDVPKEAPTPGLARSLLGAVLLAAAAWLRSSAVLIVPALLVRGVGGDRKRGALVAAVTVALYLPWMIHSKSLAAEAPRPSTQLLVFDYNTALFHTDPGDPDSPAIGAGDVLERVSTNAADMAETLGHDFFAAGYSDHRFETPPDEEVEHWDLITLCGITGLLTALAVAWTAWRRRSLMDGYLVAYVGFLLVYFTFADRLIMPVLPLLLSAVAYASKDMGRWLAERVNMKELAWGVGALVLLGVGVRGALSLAEALDGMGSQARRQGMNEQIAGWVEQNLPEDAVLLQEWGAVFSVMCGRTTYTWRNLRDNYRKSGLEVDYALFSRRPENEEERKVERVVKKLALDGETFTANHGETEREVRVYRLR